MNDTQIIIYQSDDGKTKIETRLENETLWLNQSQIAEVFQVDRSGITKHINNIFKDGELDEKSNVQIVHIGGSDKPVKFYKLEVIMAVGYRVRSNQGTKFRNWATTVLKEYLVKGFTMNDELLKEAGGGTYFEELLARIRDIRSSEKVFYRKILDIYETSVDYDPNTEISEEFFKTVQNKMHFAAHGHTAAEIIFQRADAEKQNMGLTTFKGEKPNKKEIQIAKNYLNEDELNILNRIVVAYLEFAELQALNRKPMYMKDWIVKLDDFLKMSGRELLESKGIRSHTQAINKAKDEYEKFKQKTKDELSRIEKDFVKYIEKTGKALKDKK
ncbi:virulence RhuM family protein [Aliarcobacter butzleri]|uniref:virulence RhuM family protein n=1 Tax=Aliarcobacter butzleri TaxID=28197 RepID=UPI0028770350|nr:virulence RhuM family protein [Aliarcobacter butzleri]MDS1369731.1 virulence RhuM family protein [Aliarcobacter butzleri]